MALMTAHKFIACRVHQAVNRDEKADLRNLIYSVAPQRDGSIDGEAELSSPPQNAGGREGHLEMPHEFSHFCEVMFDGYLQAIRRSGHAFADNIWP